MDEVETFLDGRVRTYRLPQHNDPRGALTPLDLAGISFVARHAFTVSDVPDGMTRGGHAHRRASQLLVRLSGRIAVEFVFHGERGSLILDPACPAVLIAPGVWSSQTYRGANALLLVLSDGEYDPHAYIREPG